MPIHPTPWLTLLAYGAGVAIGDEELAAIRRTATYWNAVRLTRLTALPVLGHLALTTVIASPPFLIRLALLLAATGLAWRSMQLLRRAGVPLDGRFPLIAVADRRTARQFRRDVCWCRRTS